MLEVKTTDTGIIFKVYVQPGASANRLAGCRQDALKLRLTAPPANGEANRACLKFLAKEIKVPKSTMEIISGTTRREKKILVRIQDTGEHGKIADRIKKRLKSLADKKTS